MFSLLFQAHKNCRNMSEIEAKVCYVKLAHSLKTYGVSFFLVKVEQWLPWPKFPFSSISPSVVELLPINLRCSSFPCIRTIFLSFLAFPVCCLPTSWFTLFLIFKPHVMVVAT